MSKYKIIETVNKLFTGVDERNWELVSRVLYDTVLLDYTSMMGGEPARLSSHVIINSWKGLLPGFDKTHHQLGNYIVENETSPAKLFCYGTASHYLKNETNSNLWTVVGTYNFELKDQNDNLKITKMKFNLKYVDGNIGLPVMAQERLKKQQMMV